MARSDIFLESFISYYGKLGMDAVALMRTTREEMRTESFDCRKTAGRTALWWLDAYEGWWSALLTSGTPPLPILFINARADSGTDSGSVRVPVPGVSKPEMTSLTRVGTGETIDATVETTNFRDQISVALPALKNPKPGTYQAIVYLDRMPLALVVVQIQAAGGNGGGGNRNARVRKAAKKPRQAAKKKGRKPAKKKP
ncbi:MAG TPA: hypothetical protein VL049_07120 [Candidatus Dormibacteraeota bacterium]|nr:hypothetical protein [Candidatus Dormibacteraeota bacterium]